MDAQLEAGRELADDCKNAPNSELLPYLSTSATVDDMDSIRAALGEDQISYLGFSYGTYLGALYADKYPDRVRAMVLDGARGSVTRLRGARDAIRASDSTAC